MDEIGGKMKRLSLEVNPKINHTKKIAQNDSSVRYKRFGVLEADNFVINDTFTTNVTQDKEKNVNFDDSNGTTFGESSQNSID